MIVPNTMIARKQLNKSTKRTKHNMLCAKLPFSCNTRGKSDELISHCLLISCACVCLSNYANWSTSLSVKSQPPASQIDFQQFCKQTNLPPCGFRSLFQPIRYEDVVYRAELHRFRKKNIFSNRDLLLLGQVTERVQAPAFKKLRAW